MQKAKQSTWVTKRIVRSGNKPERDLLREDRPRIKKRRQSTFRYQPEKLRQVRQRLIPALLEEIERGDAITKLYASLLAKEVLEREPRLKRFYYDRLWLLNESDQGSS